MEICYWHQQFSVYRQIQKRDNITKYLCKVVSWKITILWQSETKLISFWMAQNVHKENEVGLKRLINLIFWRQDVQNTRHKNEILSNLSLIIEILLWLFQTSKLYRKPASWNLWEQKFPVPFLLITLRKNLKIFLKTSSSTSGSLLHGRFYSLPNDFKNSWFMWKDNLINNNSL